MSYSKCTANYRQSWLNCTFLPRHKSLLLPGFYRYSFKGVAQNSSAFSKGKKVGHGLSGAIHGKCQGQNSHEWSIKINEGTCLSREAPCLLCLLELDSAPAGKGMLDLVVPVETQLSFSHSPPLPAREGSSAVTNPVNNREGRTPLTDFYEFSTF